MPKAEGGIGDVLQHDIVRDDVFVQVLQEERAALRLDVEQKMIVEAQDISVGQYAALRVEEEGIAARARGPRLFTWLVVMACSRRARSSPVTRMRPRRR